MYWKELQNADASIQHIFQNDADCAVIWIYEYGKVGLVAVADTVHDPVPLCIEMALFHMEVVECMFKLIILLRDLVPGEVRIGSELQGKGRSADEEFILIGLDDEATATLGVGILFCTVTVVAAAGIITEDGTQLLAIGIDFGIHGELLLNDGMDLVGSAVFGKERCDRIHAG